MDTLLRNVSPRLMILVMSGVFLLIVAMLLTYGLWPQIAEYRQSQSTIALLEDAVVNTDSMGGEIENIKKEISVLDKNLHSEMLDMPDRQMEAYIIGRLQEISWKNRIKLLGVRPGMASTVSSLEEIPFDVEVSGDYFDLYAWLRNLGSELGFLAIRQFNISPLKSGDDETVLKASLTLVSYREATNG